MPIRFEGTPRTRRDKRWQIDLVRLLDLLRANDGVRHLHQDGLPADARPVGLTVDRAWNTIDVYLESDSFDEVSENEMPPELLVAFTEFLEREVPELP